MHSSSLNASKQANASSSGSSARAKKPDQPRGENFSRQTTTNTPPLPLQPSAPRGISTPSTSNESNFLTSQASSKPTRALYAEYYESQFPGITGRTTPPPADDSIFSDTEQEDTNQSKKRKFATTFEQEYPGITGINAPPAADDSVFSDTEQDADQSKNTKSAESDVLNTDQVPPYSDSITPTESYNDLQRALNLDLSPATQLAVADAALDQLKSEIESKKETYNP